MTGGRGRRGVSTSDVPVKWGQLERLWDSSEGLGSRWKRDVEYFHFYGGTVGGITEKERRGVNVSVRCEGVRVEGRMKGGSDKERSQIVTDSRKDSICREERCFDSFLRI